MSEKKYLRVERGHVTMANLRDSEKSLYITGLADFYEIEFKVNPHNNVRYENGKLLNRAVKESLYDFLMETLSEKGAEPRDLAKKIIEKYSVDDFYDRIVDLHAIGTKTAILATIALTGEAPSITKNLSDQVCEAIFVSSDKTNLVSQNTNPVVCRGGDDYSTALDMHMVESMVDKFCAIVLRECGFKKEKLPSLDELEQDVYARMVSLDNGKVMLRSQYTLEQRLKSMCDARVRADDFVTIDDEIRVEADGADIVAAGLDEYQYNAVKMVVEGKSKVYTITGKAGTGKSHVISALYRMYNGRCVLTAYQNSACDVLSRRVGGYQFADKPIKSLIGLSMTLNANKKFAAEFSTVQMVIIDESSQIGTAHLEHVLNIVSHASNNAKLVFVGDILQTRPVNTYGLPFVHLVRNKLCPSADLAMFHRTNGLGILALCEKIRSATDKTIVTIEPGSEGVTLSQGPHTAKYWNEMCTAIADEYEEAGDDITKCMTISERNVDCNYINWMVTCKIFGEDMPDIEVASKRLPTVREGMVVRSTVNAAGELWKLTNGTRYYISAISEDGIVLKDANGETQCVPLKKVVLSDFQVAYAITVHKSQGTEASNVRYVFRRNRDFSNVFSADKTLKYVAFSRAKESITLHEIYSPQKESSTGPIRMYLNESKLYDMSI